MHILIKLLGFDTTQSSQVDTDPSEEHAASTFRAEWLGPNLTLKCPLYDFVSHMYKKSYVATSKFTCGFKNGIQEANTSISANTNCMSRNVLEKYGHGTEMWWLTHDMGSYHNIIHGKSSAGITIEVLYDTYHMTTNLVRVLASITSWLWEI
jgi:hypothetical protein